MLKGLRCQQDALALYGDNNNRVREQISQRVFWYFLTSLSPMTNGSHHVGSDTSTGHHGFTVLAGPEKAFWTEKEDA